jgi:adenosylcobinamide kinase/adenosylcobinamide-phosphate guanylyltransferase
VSRVTLITGGARSGKSTHALTLAEPRASKAFIATAQVVDDEMRARIEKHRAERGNSFTTIEAPLDLAEGVRSVPDGCEVAVVDCLTVWLGNLMHAHGPDAAYPEVGRFLENLADAPCDLILVTNEVGMGIVPDNELARAFRDRAGRLNQRVAELADVVVFVVSGIPMTIKEGRQF